MSLIISEMATRFNMSEDDVESYYSKYKQHKYSGYGRVDKLGVKIEFKLSFEEWLEIWVNSGHISERGKTKDSYVMARKGDIGHYEVGNVEIKSASDNLSEGQIGRVYLPESKLKEYQTKLERGTLKGGRPVGYKVTEETKEKIRQANTGSKRSESAKQSMSEAAKNRKKKPFEELSPGTQRRMYYQKHPSVPESYKP
jgi:hypothetical protein